MTRQSHTTDVGRVAASGETGSRASHRAKSSVVSTKGFDPARIELGLPWPWNFHKIAIRGDTCFFWATSSRTFAVGFEHLQDGFVFFLGVFVVGWASMSAALERGEAA